MKRRKLLNDGQKKWVTLAFQITLDIDDGWKVCYTAKGERKMLKQILCLKKKFLGKKNEKDKIYGWWTHFKKTFFIFFLCNTMIIS